MNDQQYSDPELRGGGSPDDILRRRFAALRREEGQQAPEFARLWQTGAGARRRQARWFAAAACMLVALLALLWIRSVQHRSDDKTIASITEWKAPTDFLLETPGRELLRAVPEIGEWQVYNAMPGATRSPRGKKILQ